MVQQNAVGRLLVLALLVLLPGRVPAQTGDGPYRNTRRAADAILDGLRTVTDKPVWLVVNTHWHGDHVFGNQSILRAFPGGRFIAHSATRSGIQTDEVEYRDVNRPKMEVLVRELAAMPSRTEAGEREPTRLRLQLEVWEGDYVLPEALIDERLTLMQGSRRIDILHLRAGNTPGDLVVHLPVERIAIIATS